MNARAPHTHSVKSEVDSYVDFTWIICGAGWEKERKQYTKSRREGKERIQTAIKSSTEHIRKCTTEECSSDGEPEQTHSGGSGSSSSCQPGTMKRKNIEKNKQKEETQHIDTHTLLFCLLSIQVCREAPRRQVCVSAPATAAPAPSGRPAWSLGSPGLCETGREAPPSLARRGRTWRRGSLPVLQDKEAGFGDTRRTRLNYLDKRD